MTVPDIYSSFIDTYTCTIYIHEHIQYCLVSMGFIFGWNTQNWTFGWKLIRFDSMYTVYEHRTIERTSGLVASWYVNILLFNVVTVHGNVNVHDPYSLLHTLFLYMYTYTYVYISYISYLHIYSPTLSLSLSLSLSVMQTMSFIDD